MKYEPQIIEKKWQDFWEKHPEIFAASEKSTGEKQYILDMFPYPSGEGLHTGHVESYTATDIYARYQRMNGKNVLHPQGWDAFGLPAENFAIKTGVHPKETTQKAIANFKRQMKMMGLSYDWSREVNSSEPNYYKWTQWFFLLLYKNGLAYKKNAKVNWCASCQTVLANEQAEGGICERCQNKVIQKDLKQWFFKITDFMEDKGKTAGLISGLEKVDWPESTKQAQINWIGKSEGAQFKMSVVTEKSDKPIDFVEVFTTRLDTVFGMTYAVVAPEHEILRNQESRSRIKNYKEVSEYLEASKKKTDLERMETKNKTGVELKGIKVINPLNREVLPLFVADYVLSHYGTGAVMAVPAHDERDFQFAKKYNLEVREVITSKDKNPNKEEVFVDYGVLINSGDYNDLTSEQAKEKLVDWLEKEKIGKRKINYKLRDWLVSRQRYWGAPIPIIYCEKCGEMPVPEKDLPVLLPDDVDFKPTGESPLVYSKKFHRVKCPKCGAEARRESDTMDTFVCSSWYYFRYADPQNKKEFASKKQLQKWLPVDLYVGGAEHTVLHLLYSRFFTKVLHNLGYLSFDEPFAKLRHQGIILAEDGRKMSKSLGNVINPDEVVKQYGADSLRMFEMFMGPLEDAKPWNTKGITGIYRFLEKIKKLSEKVKSKNEKQQRKTQNLIHKTIKKVSEDIESLKFNTAISALMLLTNELTREKELPITNYQLLIILLAPFAPHLAEELWSQLGHKESIFKEKWPVYDKKLIKEEEIEIPVMINGKLRDTLMVAPEISEEEIEKLVLKSPKVQKWLENKKLRKFIYVKGRVVNIVV